jgi:putative chitinase
MIQVTADDLKRFAPKITDDNAAAIAHYFMQYAPEYGVTTPYSVQYFFANGAHETGGFTRFEENLNYSAERLVQVFPKYFTAAQANNYARIPINIANRVYASRMGNGPESSGDGWKYRGRGIFQLTGKDNYRAASQHLYSDSSLLDHPEDVSKPVLAVRTALHFWKSRGLTPLADARNFKAVVQAINGGLNGLGDRSEWLAQAQGIFKEI